MLLNLARVKILMTIGLTISYILSATTSPAVAIGLRDISPYTLATLRNFLTAFIFLLLLRLTRTDISFNKSDYRKIILTGFLGYGASNALLFLGLKVTSVVSASLLSGLYPIAIAILSIIYLHEHIQRHLVLAILLSFGGAMVISVFTPETLHFTGVTQNAWGNLFVIIAVVLGAIGFVITKDLLARNEPLVVITGSFIVGGVVLFPISIIEFSIGSSTRLTNVSVATLIYLVVICGVVSHLLWILVLNKAAASTVGVFAYLTPVFGALLGVVLFHEKLTLAIVIGGVSILTGLGLTTNLSHTSEQA